MTTAIIPLKDLVQAKTRLAGVLGPSERRALAQAMAEDVLVSLTEHPGVERVILVSDDPSAALLANSYRAECWSERSLECRGLNAVLCAASERVRQQFGGAQIILHADIPLLCASDIDEVLCALRDLTSVVVGPDRARVGTNLLAFSEGRAPAFHFGANSRALHMAAVAASNCHAQEVTSMGIGLDVDEPEDLALLLSSLGGGRAQRTQTMISTTGVSSRLRLTLATLSSQRIPPPQETSI